MIGKILPQNYSIYRNTLSNKNNKTITNSKMSLPFDTVNFSNAAKVNFTGRQETMVETMGQTELPWFDGDYSSLTLVMTDEINILGGDEAHLIDVAEGIYPLGTPDILNFCVQWKKGIFGILREDKNGTTLAFQRIMPVIERVRQKVESLTTRKEELEDKQINGTLDLTEQKRMLAIEFIQAADLADKGIETDVPNGILLYGNSEENRNTMYDWIKQKSDFMVKEVAYDASDPDGSIDKLSEALEDAEFIYGSTKVRTLIDLKDFDVLFASYKTSRENRRTIARFKNMAEDIAKKYHTTFILRTGHDIKDLEPAAIGAQRFDIAFNLSKLDLTTEESKELSAITTELDRLKQKAIEGRARFRRLDSFSDNKDTRYMDADEYYREFW